MTLNRKGAIAVPPTRRHTSTRPMPILALAGMTAVLLAWNPAQAAGTGDAHGGHHMHGGDAAAAGQGHGHATGHEHAGHTAFGHPGKASEVDRTVEI